MRLRKLSSVYVLVFVLTASIIFPFADVAHAALTGTIDCSRQAFGRCMNQGYFTGDNKVDTGNPIVFPLDNKFAYQQSWYTIPVFGVSHWVYPEISESVGLTRQDAYTETFITLHRNYIDGDFSACASNPTTGYEDDTNPGGSGQNAGSCYNRRRNAVGSAFIINTMLAKMGSDYGTHTYHGTGYRNAYANGIQFARDNFNRWADLVRYYNENSLVAWNATDASPAGHFNSTAINYATDNTVFWNDDGTLMRSIQFRSASDPSTILFTINRSCGNITGETTPPPPAPPQNTVSCTVNDSIIATPGEIRDMSVTFSPGTTTPHAPISYTVSHSISGIAPANDGSVSPSSGSWGADSTATSVIDVNGITIPNSPGTYNGTVTLTLTGAQNSSTTCDLTIEVVTQPYLRVYGGDVIAGVGFVENDCTPSNSSSRILTYNRGPSSYAGSATDLAVFALGGVDQFASRAGGGTLAPRHLTFANTDDTVTYGGSSGLKYCVPDYWAGAENIQSSLNITDRTVGVGPEEVFYVEGNATITGNVLYTTGGWTSFEDIPGFSLIVKGNIFIDRNVTQLSGTYVAIPSGAGTGIIYTCTDIDSPYSAPIQADADGCGNKLTIHGAFVADQVKFLRTNGNTGNAPNNEGPDSSNIAEVFIFGPEMWVGR